MVKGFKLTADNVNFLSVLCIALAYESLVRFVLVLLLHCIKRIEPSTCGLGNMRCRKHVILLFIIITIRDSQYRQDVSQKKPPVSTVRSFSHQG